MKTATRTLTMIIALAMIGIIGALCTATPAMAEVVTVTRDLPDSFNTTLTVNLTVDVEYYVSYYTVDEVVPPGWTITSASAGGDFTTAPGHVFWVALKAAPVNTTYSYTVEAPANASCINMFNGVYLCEFMETATPILGDTSVTIYDSADTDHDCKVSMPELMAQIGKWKSGEVGMMELMSAIDRWKAGEY